MGPRYPETELVNAKLGVVDPEQPYPNLARHESWLSEICATPAALEDLDHGNKKGSRCMERFWSASAVLMRALSAFAGSNWTFGAIMLLILAWCIWGICTQAPDIWQITFQDVGSMQSYLWDITLLYTQRRDFEELLQVFGVLKTNGNTALATVHRLLSVETHLPALERKKDSEQIEDTGELKQKAWYDKLADWVSHVSGSPYAQTANAVGIFVWLGLGAYYGWSDGWQLVINTATALEITIITAFLQNNMQRHRAYTKEAALQIGSLDIQLADRMHCALCTPNCPTCNTLKGSVEDMDTCNDANHMRGFGAWWKRNMEFKRIVTMYSEFMGSLAGVILTIIFMVIWAGIGALPSMGYSNSNWLLINGTYTGSIGFLNAFVLRYLMGIMENDVMDQADELDKIDAELSAALKMAPIEAPRLHTRNYFERASVWLSDVLAHKWSLIVAGLFIIALLIAATVLGWNESAQLLVNTPPMILEAQCMLVLMAAHMAGCCHLRGRLRVLLQRRLRLQRIFDFLAGMKPTARSSLNEALTAPMPEEAMEVTSTHLMPPKRIAPVLFRSRFST